jgi:hypothetical protein
MFMKDNVTAGEKFMGGKVVEFISFLADWVPEKNTTCSLRSIYVACTSVAYARQPKTLR